MDLVREVARRCSSLRKAKKLRVRLPLPKLTVAVENPQRLEPFARSDRRRAQRQERRAHRRHRHLRPLRADRERQASRDRGSARTSRRRSRRSRRARGRQCRRNVERRTGCAAARGVQLAARCGRTRVHRRAARRVPGLVVLDGTVTEELEAEGWAKDRIRELQELRKSTGLEVSDRISVVMAVPRRTRLGTHTQRPHRARNPGHQLRIRRADPGH